LLTTVSASGVVRSVVLSRIATGRREPDENNSLGVQRFAGLAVDLRGNRAFAVGAEEPIAEVDLGTLCRVLRRDANALEAARRPVPRCDLATERHHRRHGLRRPLLQERKRQRH
jgi:hypothetical protein